MDKQTLITKSGNWSDDNLTIPFEKGMDKQIRDMLLDSVEEALKDKEYCCKDPFGTGRFNVKRQDSARIKKVGSNAVVVLIRVVVDKSYCSQVCRELILRERAGRIDFSRVRSVNLDEYKGLAPDHPQSYRRG